MKLKIILSMLTAGLYALLSSLLNFFYAPITGSLAAQQVNDSVADYGIAKFVRDGYAGDFLLLVAVLLIAMVWILIPNRPAIAKSGCRCSTR